MGRTLPSATQIILHEEKAFGRFRRALRRSDQLVLDDLFSSARQHTAAAQYAAHALPFEVFILSMVLEEHKEVMKLREQVKVIELREWMVHLEMAKPRSNNTGSGCVDPGFGFEDDPKDEDGAEQW
jgi:hypothetical protein